MMKKLFALILALLMTAALVACGNQDDNSGSDTGAPEVSTGETDLAPDPGEDLGDEPVDFAWGNSWLQNSIPQPPFEGWETIEATDAICRMECATGVIDTNAFYATCEKYVNTLNASGFSEMQDSKEYLYRGTDVTGIVVEFKYGDTYCWITITAGPEY